MNRVHFTLMLPLMRMKLRDFKKIFLKPLQHLDNKKLESDLSKKEVYQLFKKIVSGIHSNLKKHGFKKQGTNNSYRINEEIYQSLNFQKSSYNDCFTINICIRPTYWNRPEIGYLLSTRRIGNFETGKDKWYEINSNTDSTIEHITKLIEKIIIPIFDKTQTSELIIANQELLKKEKIFDQSVVMFSALRITDKKLSRKMLTEKLNTLEKDDRDVEWVVNEREYFRNLSELVKSEKWTELQKELDANKTNFYELNKNI